MEEQVWRKKSQYKQKSKQRIPLKPKNGEGPHGSKFGHVQNSTAVYLKDIVDFKLDQDEKIKINVQSSYHNMHIEKVLKKICWN